MLMNNLDPNVNERLNEDIGHVGQRPGLSRRYGDCAVDAFCVSPMRLR
jgi:hypothetical protein